MTHPPFFDSSVPAKDGSPYGYQQLRTALKKVLDAPEFSGLCGGTKGGVLLDLEGEYDPDGCG